MNTQTGLAKCIFCSHEMTPENMEWVYGETTSDDPKEAFAVGCGICGAHGSLKTTREVAKQAWNLGTLGDDELLYMENEIDRVKVDNRDLRNRLIVAEWIEDYLFDRITRLQSIIDELEPEPLGPPRSEG